METDLKLQDKFQRQIELCITKKPLASVARFDSGCPVNFIIEQLVCKIEWQPTTPEWQRYYGINKSRVPVLGVIKLRIVMDSDSRILEFGIVSDSVMFVSVLLGRNALNEFGYRLSKSPRFDKALLEIMSIELDDESLINKLNINPNTTVTDRSAFYKLFTEYYVNPVCPDFPEVKIEARIVLKTNQPVQFGPRRLSYCDKEAINKIIDSLINREIIRKSLSEYASLIVLTCKKNG
ncbi:uncharacterized protein [Cardiocondyla obscurior]|uniref:uncharacterized protein n=1 Tax=Cardiocondyla obscurior TaxID=286306 RepID=UPI0039656A8B